MPKWTFFTMSSIFLGVGLIFGCASSAPLSQKKYFEATVSLPVGAEKAKVIKLFGKPSTIKTTEDGAIYTYSFLHKNVQIPKLTVWINADGKVTEKFIWLYDQDGDVKNRQEIEALFRTSKFVVEDAPAPEDGHYIPTEKYLKDDVNGIYVEISSAHSDRANYIHWNIPVSKSALTTSQGQ